MYVIPMYLIVLFEQNKSKVPRLDRYNLIMSKKTMGACYDNVVRSLKELVLNRLYRNSLLMSTGLTRSVKSDVNNFDTDCGTGNNALSKVLP